MVPAFMALTMRSTSTVTVLLIRSSSTVAIFIRAFGSPVILVSARIGSPKPNPTMGTENSNERTVVEL
jgi:hypothetical protein